MKEKQRETKQATLKYCRVYLKLFIVHSKIAWKEIYTNKMSEKNKRKQIVQNFPKIYRNLQCKVNKCLIDRTVNIAEL